MMRSSLPFKGKCTIYTDGLILSIIELVLFIVATPILVSLSMEA
jgi:hypothetical protein